MVSPIDAGSLFRVDGLVAVITGGGTGIGLMMAKALANNGAAKVYIVGRRMESLETAAKESPHGNIIPIQGDVTSQESLAAVARKVRDDVGYVNLLVANSGISGPKAAQMKDDLSLAEFQEFIWSIPMDQTTDVFNVNFSGVLYTVTAFLELLDLGNKKGNVTQQSQVITTGSIAASARSNMVGFAYNSSKAAVTLLMKTLATYCGPKYGIRFNTIAAGLFPSEMSAPLLGDKDMTVFGSMPKEWLSSQRAGSELDMAGTILYMASRAGGYIDGSDLLVDGGRLSTVPAIR
ncbi:MAG: transcriptional repressor general negative regulator of transcription subunit 4 [Watsoniomyces obsoletus]|nr:MAG: transcriptional repressor general negative regulator of transcription subunit 4 [Watsoniomyces obsoletus]